LDFSINESLKLHVCIVKTTVNDGGISIEGVVPSHEIFYIHVDNVKDANVDIVGRATRVCCHI